MTLDTELLSQITGTEISASSQQQQLNAEDASNHSAETQLTERYPDGTTSISLKNPPMAKKKTHGLKGLALKCRERLAFIRDRTYICQDLDAMEHLLGLLDTAASYVSSKLDADDGLVLEGTSIR